MFFVSLLPVTTYCIRYVVIDTVGLVGSIHDTLTAVELSASAMRLTGEPRTGDGDGDRDTDDIDKVVADDDDDEIDDTVVIVSCDTIVELIGAGVVSGEDVLVF